MNIIIITTKANWVKYVIIKKNATVINESNPNFVLINYQFEYIYLLFKPIIASKKANI